MIDTPEDPKIEDFDSAALGDLRQHHRWLKVMPNSLRSLASEARTAFIRKMTRHAATLRNATQLLAAKMFLNCLAPGWEADAPDLAKLMAARLPVDVAWADEPLGAVQWH